MDRMLYLAMNGAKHVMWQQATTANNLANVHTNGFKADVVAFRALPVVGEARRRGPMWWTTPWVTTSARAA